MEKEELKGKSNLLSNVLSLIGGEAIGPMPAGISPRGLSKST
jgi:hypothetical protein